MVNHDYFEALSLATIACLVLQDVAEKYEKEEER